MWDKTQMTLWLANMLYALAGVLLLYAVLFLVVHLPVFPLRKVDVKGELQHVNREQVKFIVAREMKGNFFTLDLNRTRSAFEKLPWVRNVSVRRRWPDRLEVAIEEHVVLARWGSSALVNTQGELFRAASNAVLPEFNGPEDAAREVTGRYEEFSRMLKPFNLVLTRMTLSDRRALQLKLNNGLVVELGREKVHERLEKFVGVYDQTVAKLPIAVAYADLRYPNGFAVRYPQIASMPAKKAQPAARPGQGNLKKKVGLRRDANYLAVAA
ncbi:cell division protein FtsQ [Sulfuricella denitrificans skB26]|uniref:Cell division protein FtsQ n=1 Tax=Sulfuricella denitrificans (strain DSM 22764 / NBRC 105220 / skB26) TaxID=1163617 RepID=S6AD93_SULDS|nr:cell division protein FtsQ/DivIB [Sulfuricella denitrificans]BAN36288.1 cell division protein FtsQ [Sulfuricella denitrificans skB26]